MTEQLKSVRTMKSWEETTTMQSEGGPKISRALVKYTFSGAIEGDSSLDYSMAYPSPSKALFLGHEQIHGQIGARRGTFVLRHEGTFEGGTATIAVQVVPGSGTDGLAGLSGSGRITADSADPMKSTLELAADLP